jgi:polyhydroxyalkanoate synthesis regulator phasin
MADIDAAGKYYEALNETSDAMIDAIRAANDRGHRFTTALIEQAQESQREAVEISRKWADSPLDFIGLMSSVTESTTKAQGRALDATRQFFGELTEAQKESREVVQKVINANRTAGEASMEAARGAFSRATTAVQTAAEASNGSKASSAKAEPKTQKASSD